MAKSITMISSRKDTQAVMTMTVKTNYFLLKRKTKYFPGHNEVK
jgi:uncharacterized protein involved in tellurium resistance